MKIYTKTGDGGETGLYGGGRIPKDSLLIEVIGTVDELNACVGVVRSGDVSERIDEILWSIQEDLFLLGADLATPLRVRMKGERMAPEQIVRLEDLIDTVEGDLPRLKKFILPGGSAVGAQIHLARAVCRRAERLVVSLGNEVNDLAIVYLNRLSDLLFVLARLANREARVREEEWG